MTEKKRSKKIRKGLIIAIALVAALLCGSLTANAATDGALFEGIGHIVSGDKIDLKDYIVNYNSYVDEDGNEIEKYEFEFDVDEDGKGGTLKVDAEVGNDGEFMTIGVSIDNEDGSLPEHSEDTILELTKKIFDEFIEYETDKEITNMFQ